VTEIYRVGRAAPSTACHEVMRKLPAPLRVFVAAHRSTVDDTGVARGPPAEPLMLFWDPRRFGPLTMAVRQPWKRR